MCTQCPCSTHPTTSRHNTTRRFQDRIVSTAPVTVSMRSPAVFGGCAAARAQASAGQAMGYRRPERLTLNWQLQGHEGSKPTATFGKNPFAPPPGEMSDT
jgi:hypothetical protein